MQDETRNLSTAQNGTTVFADFAKGLELNGINTVISATDKEFVAKAGQNTVTVTGSSLSPELVDVERKTVKLKGRITSVSCTEQATPKSFLKRLFR